MNLNITNEDYQLMLARIAIFKKCVDDLAEIEMKFQYDCEAKRIADRTLADLRALDTKMVPPKVDPANESR